MDLGFAAHYRCLSLLLPVRARAGHGAGSSVPRGLRRNHCDLQDPIVNLLEVGLVGAVLFHAFNGIRIILIDFWSKGPRYQRQMTWVIAAIWLFVMIPGTYFMMIHTIDALFGSTT